ncbi:porin [Parapusillimonas sp. SGNA-6]|nr:porin [Parapusillimonas sp. SGNA-6]
MKKTLLAAALTVGFFGVAQAETSVTLYGILDGGIGYQQVKGNNSHAAVRTDATDRKYTKTGMINGIQSGNRWGVKGAEDLGNGLRAVFQLESGFDLGTGKHLQGDRLFGRQATVGLAGDAWGQLDLGRQTNIASKYFGAIDPFGLGFSQANAGVSFTSANTVRYDNMVMYQTPNFSGFQFGVGYSFNIDGAQSFKDDRDDDENTRAITTGLRYANGPLAVALTYDTFKVKGVDAETGTTRSGTVVGGVADGSAVFPYTAAVNGGQDTTVKSWLLGAAYDFEVVKASLAFGQTRNGYFQGNSFGGETAFNTPAFRAAEGLKFNSYLVGLSAPLGNGTLMASWQMADPRSNPDAALAGDEWDKQQVYSLGYTYGLSKRTNLYAIGSYAKHVNFLPDAKSTLIGVGVRHQF